MCTQLCVFILMVHFMSDNFFLKTTKSPQLSAEQKSVLNRKGNEFFNSGNIAMAAKIFTATGYSDGLTRVGDFYYKKNDTLTALKYYKLAHNHHNVALIVQDIAHVIQVMMNEEKQC